MTALPRHGGAHRAAVLGDNIVTKDRRAAALALVRAMPRGEARNQAYGFVRGRTRRASDIEAFIERMTAAAAARTEQA